MASSATIRSEIYDREERKQLIFLLYLSLTIDYVFLVFC